MAAENQRPKTKDQNPLGWPNVRRVLVVKLRSIGDTVLATPSLIALRRFLPDAQIDILLEDWVAPVLDGFDAVDNVISVGKSSSERLKTAWKLRGRKYDVAINLHGGTTATLFVRASGALHRIGYSYYQYPFLYNHLLSSASDFWKREKTHSAEQQLALLGFVGVPVDPLPKTRLAANERSIDTIRERHPKFEISNLKFALLHPSTAFFTKQWPTENFAQTAEFLAGKGLHVVAVGSKSESKVLEDLKRHSTVPVITFDDLSLSEITALASKARVFVGNDSGIAHIAAAVGTPSVVVFGSSNRDHWRPWTDAPNEIVFEPFACQPCPGYECKEFGEPQCILSIEPQSVFIALDRIISKTR